MVSQLVVRQVVLLLLVQAAVQLLVQAAVQLLAQAVVQLLVQAVVELVVQVVVQALVQVALEIVQLQFGIQLMVMVAECQLVHAYMFVLVGHVFLPMLLLDFHVLAVEKELDVVLLDTVR